MEPKTDQKIRENRKLQKKAVSKDGPREAQKSGDRTDTADHEGDIFRFHEETLIKLRRLGNSPSPSFRRRTNSKQPNLLIRRESKHLRCSTKFLVKSIEWGAQSLRQLQISRIISRHPKANR